MPYVALLRITPRPDHRHDDAYAVGPFDDQPQAHAYGVRADDHPQHHYGTFIGTAELVDPAAFAHIRPSPVLSFNQEDEATIHFTTNLGHTGTLTRIEAGWQTTGTTLEGKTFSVLIAGPAECAMDAKLRLQRALDTDRLPSFPPDTPLARDEP